MSIEQQNQLSLRLKELLKQHSISMGKLSELTDIDKATISRIINGKRKANLQHLEKFADCFQIPLTELLKSAGYKIERQHAEPESDTHASLEPIQSLLEASTAFDRTFSMDKVKKQLEQYEQESQQEEGKRTIFKSFEEKLKNVGSIGPYITHLKEMYEKFRLKQGTKKELAIIGSGLLYFILTLDAIPDYIFPIGYLDDAIAIQLVINLLSVKGSSIY
ncbi:helix-turn-helix domain-containing protein [Bacillus sp. PS06]|uniref:helix-turn-helix domain-containing protein n=1 Tax=Bacillus sp. PS06 TaxID=2764176 RepID=UPI00177DD089|nr:helix-turn-helix domain-containing protein [Bacillus sp. PS06]MBD8070134.1 helix-turn-helix domain-containing protein [Bacillus sp. PS06]